MRNFNTERKEGFVHSFESFGTVDGPGIRFVIFMAGCFLKCKYCHNIDMATFKGGKKWSVEEIVQKILKNREYLEASDGGVTFSGGDPFFQPDFLLEMIKRCREEGLHVTVDTSLYAEKEEIRKVAEYTDLFMVSLKHFDSEKHKFLTGVGNQEILENLKFLSDLGSRIWLRLVLLPGWTDSEFNLVELRDFCKTINFEKLELLPYHTMGVKKWEALKIPYYFNDLKVPNEEQILEVKNFLNKANIPVVLNEY